MLKAIAFDCFGTVFDMEPIPREEIAAYVSHVRSQNFEPYQFPKGWYDLLPHKDSAYGIILLQEAGFKCVALSNGSKDLIQHISVTENIHWDHIVDLVAHRVYKPHLDAYRTVEKDLGIPAHKTLMVTANPTFGDLEGSAAVGMRSCVIREFGTPNNIIELAELIIGGEFG